MSVTIVLIGPHGAGKSTFGRLLATRLGWPFHAEIGDELRREALAGDPGATALVAQPELDAEVFRRELARDRQWAGCGPRVVESWHPANLAYASLRSPRVAAAAEPILRQAAIGVGRVLVQPVWATPEILVARQREPGDVAASQKLFCTMARQAKALALGWGLELLPAMDTGSTTPAGCVATWMTTHRRAPPPLCHNPPMTKIDWEKDRRRRSVSRPAEAHRDPDGQISYARPADGRGTAAETKARRKPKPRPKPTRPRRRRSSPDDAVCPICGYRLPREVLANHMRNSHSGRHDHHHTPGRNRSRTVALVLSLLLGPWGVDRFYLGQPGLGLLKLLSFGGCGLWWALDVLRIATGNPRDGRGRELGW